MASDYSTYIGNQFVRWLAGNAFDSAPASLYLALFDGDPKGAGTEVTADIRSAGRVAVDLEDAPAEDGETNSITTDGDSDFGASESSESVDITHVAIFDAETDGNLICSKAVTPVSVELGELVKAVAGDLTFEMGS
jgi:hypothetical protein